MQEPIKILSIFNHYSEEGGEAYAVNAVCRALAKTTDITRCEFRSTDWQGPKAPPAWKQAAWIFRNPSSLRQLRACQASCESNLWLVHNVFPVGSAGIYAEAKTLGIPVIQYIHNFRPFSVNGYLWANNRVADGGLRLNYWEEIVHGSWQNSRLKTACFATVLWLTHAAGYWRNVTAWIAISNFLKDKFIRAGIPASKIFTLRHFWRPRSGSFPSYGDHYLFLGRLTEAKGVGVLLNAWKILHRRCGTAAPRLVIAGSGPLCSEVKAEAERNPAVVFAGHLIGEEKMEALNKARAVIVPSLWWEGLGLVVYEAYDYSRPVLAARSGALPEIVVEGETGFLHTPGNAEELASQVMAFEYNRPLCLCLGEQGRKWLERNASEAEWQARFHEIAVYASDSKSKG